MTRRGRHAESPRERRTRLRAERRSAGAEEPEADGVEHDEVALDDEAGLDDEVGLDDEFEHDEVVLASEAGARDEPAVPREADRLASRGIGAALGLAVALALVGGTVTYLLLAGPTAAESGARGPAAETVDPDQSTLLLIRREGESGPAEGLTLIAAGPQDEAVVVFLPVGTLVDIPGVGLDRLGLTHQYGGPALAQAAVENLLGIQVDHVATVTTAGLASLLDRTGGIDVAVPSRLVQREEDGTAEVRFEPGQQVLDGARLAEYWAFVARGEDELASFPRQQAVLRGLLAELADPSAREVVIGDGAPQLSTAAEPAWMADHLTAVAQALAANQLRVTLLPVESFGGQGPDGGATFRASREAIDELVAESLAGSVPADGVAGAVRIQVLNGVGVPGIGQHVDRSLGGGSFRIVLTDNARSFDFTETRILVYEETPFAMQAAERVQERLGVGTIQVSRQPQSVVDVTIVVGSDYLDVHGIPGADPEEAEAVDDLDDLDEGAAGDE